MATLTFMVATVMQPIPLNTAIRTLVIGKVIVRHTRLQDIQARSIQDTPAQDTLLTGVQVIVGQWIAVDMMRELVTRETNSFFYCFSRFTLLDYENINTHAQTVVEAHVIVVGVDRPLFCGRRM